MHEEVNGECFAFHNGTGIVCSEVNSGVFLVDNTGGTIFPQDSGKSVLPCDTVHRCRLADERKRCCISVQKAEHPMIEQKEDLKHKLQK